MEDLKANLKKHVVKLCDEIGERNYVYYDSLELARLSFGTEAGRTIKFIAFVNEEPPFFFSDDMGSRVYARDAKKRSEDIKAMLCLETIGYYSERRHSQMWRRRSSPE